MALFRRKPKKPSSFKDRVAGFWDWFEKHAPVHCVDLLKYYEGDEFYNMAVRVAVKVEQLIAPAKEASQHTG